MAYFSRKMILAETWYKTHNNKLLVILEAFKTWWYNLEGCKHEFLVLTNYNNFCQFMNTRNLISCQVRWAQELLQYHFQIDYHQRKANRVADALFCFSQRNQVKEDKLQTENTQILHKLQSSLTNTSFSGLCLTKNLSPLYQIFICGTHILPQVQQF